MGQRIRRIDRTDELATRLREIGTGPLALDTEADSFHHYREQVCLVQMSFNGIDFLVDPLAQVDLGVLAPVLGNRGVRKILHGADYDLRLLHRDHGLELQGLFDTMIAARLCGDKTFGLSALLGKHLGLTLDKSHQRADWSRRPLTAEMEAYAAMDTRHLPELCDLLERRLRELGRHEWAVEEFERLEAVRWSAERDSGADYTRVKGSLKLDPREQAVVREVYTLRDAKAQQRDVPPFRVLRDAVLLRLAEAKPCTPAELSRIPEMPRPWLQSAQAAELLAAIRRAMELPPERLPLPERKAPRRRDALLETRIRELSRKRDRLAEGLGLESPLLATRRLIEELAVREQAGLEPGALPELRRWQAQVLRALF